MVSEDKNAVTFKKMIKMLNVVPISIMKRDIKKKYANFNLQSFFNRKTVKRFVN
jgi:hypothetical protein